MFTALQQVCRDIDRLVPECVLDTDTELDRLLRINGLRFARMLVSSLSADQTFYRDACWMADISSIKLSAYADALNNI